MGNVVCWLTQCWYPREQVFWVAVCATTVHTPSGPRHHDCHFTRGSSTLSGTTPFLVEPRCWKLQWRMRSTGAKLEIVKLYVPAVNRFKANWRGKTPLDVARSRFSEEGEQEREGGEAGACARCVDVMEKMLCVYSGVLYENTDNVLSLVSGISSLNSWTRRFCLVLERGHPSVLEPALFSIKDDGSMRPVCPTSVMLCNVAPGMKAVRDPRCKVID
uniref:Uncharacterized protein n=1 Tax=Peronospora matthiolae TaxID=2874970 RepID=A0AAV1UX88_9STRA